jgi:chromatin assembly factor 1 subunit B
MSTSSIASSFMQPNNGESSVLMHATPSLSSVGGVAAAHSGPVPGNVPLWTPPETPMAGGGGPILGGGHRTHSASSSVSGIGSFATRRESEIEPSIEVGDGSKKREAEFIPEEGNEVKKRRIAPTHVSIENGNGPPPNAPNQPSASG